MRCFSGCNRTLVLTRYAKVKALTLGNYFCNLSRKTPLPSVTCSEINMLRNVFVAVTVARKKNQLLLLETIAATQKLRDMFISEHVTLGNDSCKLCRNKIARQVARKIVWCNSAFNEAVCPQIVPRIHHTC